jgi:hypothetical protein
LLGRRGRTALLVSAVALAASLVVAVTSGMRTVQASLEDSISKAMGATDARIVHRYAEPFDASLLDDARKWTGVERAAGRLSGSITLAAAIDATTAGGSSLTVNTAGTTTFGGIVGGIRRHWPQPSNFSPTFSGRQCRHVAQA